MPTDSADKPPPITVGSLAQGQMKKYQLPPTARREVPLDRLHPNDRNLRQPKAADLVNMETSLRTNGQINPLKAGPTRHLPPEHLLTYDGNTRLGLMRRLGFETAVVDVFAEGLTPTQEVALQLTLDAASQKLGLKQVAEGAKRLLDSGEFQTLDEIAAAVGCSTGWLSKAFTTACRLHPLLAAGDLPDTVKYEISKADDPELQLRLADMYRTGELKRDAIAPAIEAFRSPGRRVKRAKAVRFAAKGLCGALSGTVDVAEAEAARLLKAIQKARALGLGLAAVPDLMRNAGG